MTRRKKRKSLKQIFDVKLHKEGAMDTLDVKVEGKSVFDVDKRAMKFFHAKKLEKFGKRLKKFFKR